VLDVRREPEWEAGHIANALWWPLDNFKVAPPEIDHDIPIAVHCKGGYRSLIALQPATASRLSEHSQCSRRLRRLAASETTGRYREAGRSVSGRGCGF